MAVAQNTYAVSWFKGKELNLVFGLQLSMARIVSVHQSSAGRGDRSCCSCWGSFWVVLTGGVSLLGLGLGLFTSAGSPGIAAMDSSLGAKGGEKVFVPGACQMGIVFDQRDSISIK